MIILDFKNFFKIFDKENLSGCPFIILQTSEHGKNQYVWRDNNNKWLVLTDEQQLEDQNQNMNQKWFI